MKLFTKEGTKGESVGNSEASENSKMTLVSSYLLIVTPNANGGRFAVQRHTVPERAETETRLRAACKRRTGAARTHTGSKSRTGKDSRQVQTKGERRAARLTSDQRDLNTKQ